MSSIALLDKSTIFPAEEQRHDVLHKTVDMAAYGAPQHQGTRVLQLVDETLTAADYFLATEDSPPLKSNRIQILKKGIDDIRYNGISLSKIGAMFMSTMLIVNSYISHYELITGKLPSPSSYPILGALMPLYGLYMNSSIIQKNYEDFKNASNSDEKYNTFFELMGTASAMLYNVVCLAGYICFSELTESVKIGLYTLSYIASIADIMRAEYYSLPTAEEMYTKPPEFIKV
jgi:hypothetical protein